MVGLSFGPGGSDPKALAESKLLVLRLHQQQVEDLLHSVCQAPPDCLIQEVQVGPKDVLFYQVPGDTDCCRATDHIGEPQSKSLQSAPPMRCSQYESRLYLVKTRSSFLQS